MCDLDFLPCVDNLEEVAQETVRIPKEQRCSVTVSGVSDMLKHHLQLLKSHGYMLVCVKMVPTVKMIYNLARDL